MSKNKKIDCIIEPAISEQDAYILGLEGNVKGFKMALTVISIIVFAAILLYIFNPVALQGDVTDINSTKSKIVYMTISTVVFFVCLTLLAKMFIKMKQGASASASGTNTNDTSKTYTVVNLILTVCSLIIILIIAFSDDFRKNTALSMNYFIMFVLIVVSCIIYLFSTKDDYVSFNKLPRPIQMFYSDRAKYSILFVLYIFTIAILYYYDPWNIITKYMGLTIFFTSIVGITIVLMIYLYQFYFTNPSHSSTTGDSPTFVKFITTSVYILSAMSISGLLLYGLLSLLGTFNQDSYNSSNLGHTVLNYIMLAGMLAVIWKLANSGGYLAKNPVFQLILNIILYIPCILVNIVDYFTGQYNTSKQTELKMLLIALSLFVSYFLLKYLIMPSYSKKYYGQGGNSIVNEPLTLEKTTLVASYQDLNNGAYVDQSNIGGKNDGSGLQTNSVANFFRKFLNIDSDSDPKRNYHYALSFWFYLDSFPPSTSTAYNKTSNLVSFGGNPAVRYNAVTNSLIISMKYNDPSCKIATAPRQRLKTNVTSESINTLEGFNQMRNEIRSKIEDVKAMPTQVELDEDGNMIVYVKEGVLLQKWNNVVLNYNGGTLDIFYNGQLVKSAIELVPCITFDTLKVGDDNGVSGNVANLLYFNESIDYIKVNTLYNSLKGMNPPIIPGSGPTMLQRVITSLK